MTSGFAGAAGRMQIARGLQSLRNRAGLTLAQVADRSGFSKSTVARYEGWQDRAQIRWSTVKNIAEACGGKPEEIALLVKIAQAPDEGWWVGNSAVPEWMDPLVSFEQEADYEHVYANTIVPGLLQTPAYALATHQAQEVRIPAEEIERKVNARMQRQDILKRQPPLHLWVVLDEAVLRRVVGNTAVMADQLDHLRHMARQPNIDLQVLPFTVGAHAAGSGGHFVLLGRDDERHPLNSMAVAYIEMHRRGLYLDHPDDLRSYKVTFAYLRSQALNVSASEQLLADVRKEY